MKKKDIPPQTRINWSKGEKKDILNKAVKEWLNKTGRYFYNNGKVRSMADFCSHVGVPYNTFQKYVCTKKSTCRIVGKSLVGRPPLVKEELQKSNH